MFREKRNEGFLCLEISSDTPPARTGKTVESSLATEQHRTYSTCCERKTNLNRCERTSSNDAA